MKPLTIKEKKAIEGIMAGKSKRRAIKDAYDCKSLAVADVIGQKVFKREKVIKELQVWREKEKDLIPKSYKVIDNILSTEPKGNPTWDVLRKTAENNILRVKQDEAVNKTTTLNFYSRFIKSPNKIKELTSKSIEIVQEDNSIEDRV